MTEDRVYLDHAATTPIRPEALEAMLPYLTVMAANPAASYRSARTARRALEEAREATAGVLGARPSEIFFTSGGTESNNWALRALLSPAKQHIVTDAAEHLSVLAVCDVLKSEGYDVSLADVDRCARASLESTASLIRPDTAMVSVMYANNETGALNDVRAISRAAHERGVPFHTDAVAAVGHVRIDVARDEVDLLSLSAHKFYGPAGVGALYIRQGFRPAALLQGGHQERGLRAGTQNVAGAVGLARALELAAADIHSETERLRRVRSTFRNALTEELPGVWFLTPDDASLPGTLTVCIPGLNAAAALIQLDRDGFEVAAGAACSAGAEKTSHVFLAAGMSPQDSRSVLRISLGRTSCEEHAGGVATSLSRAVKRARR